MQAKELYQEGKMSVEEYIEARIKSVNIVEICDKCGQEVSNRDGIAYCEECGVVEGNTHEELI